jgi:hypothetical protein
VEPPQRHSIDPPHKKEAPAKQKQNKKAREQQLLKHTHIEAGGKKIGCGNVAGRFPHDVDARS